MVRRSSAVTIRRGCADIRASAATVQNASVENGQAGSDIWQIMETIIILSRQADELIGVKHEARPVSGVATAAHPTR